MKKFLAILICILCAVSLWADDLPKPFPLLKNPLPIGGNTGSGDNGESGGDGRGNEGGEDPGKGHRAPARPVFCSIDFDSAEVNITGYDSAEIESYEICDAESHACIFATNDCAEFVAELANTHETVYVIFYFDDFTLCGYFTR